MNNIIYNNKRIRRWIFLYNLCFLFSDVLEDIEDALDKNLPKQHEDSEQLLQEIFQNVFNINNFEFRTDETTYENIKMFKELIMEIIPADILYLIERHFLFDYNEFIEMLK